MTETAQSAMETATATPNGVHTRTRSRRVYAAKDKRKLKVTLRQLIGGGLSIDGAAARLGLPTTTARYWLEAPKGKQGRPAYTDKTRAAHVAAAFVPGVDLDEYAAGVGISKASLLTWKRESEGESKGEDNKPLPRRRGRPMAASPEATPAPSVSIEKRLRLEVEFLRAALRLAESRGFKVF